MTNPEEWQEARNYTPERLQNARKVLEEIRAGQEMYQAVRRYPLPGGGYTAKHVLIAAYQALVDSGEWPADPDLLTRIRMKPVRTLSGVTTVTVLTKPYPCPGKCIFCPTDVRMPKSYLPDEPGARRGLEHHFDPYDQVRSRIQALEAVGHPTDKIELLILGGTWSAYRRDYQEWFVQRCFDALNLPCKEDEAAFTPSECLAEAQRLNETGEHRNVGLVIETRPDEITPKELAWLRRLGVTKVQLGAQSLDDRVLGLNQRGHDAAETLRATALLRAAGFKFVLHWMPNLLGATIDSDREDFFKLWNGYCPDELKIYPCQLLANADLYAYWQRGEYLPYTQEELIGLIADIKPSIPTYCRVNRVIRDIPSTNVVAGNKRTSLRQDVQEELARRGQRCSCIRCREVRGDAVDAGSLVLKDTVYPATHAEEHFLTFETPAGQIAGYLRLSIPGKADPAALPFLDPQLGFSDLPGAALIREVHVYGQSLPVGGESSHGAAQHIGLGTRLLRRSEEIAAEAGCSRLAVIAAVGTREYYIGRGFKRGELYLVKRLPN
ncbi:MAG TPA: tRNA uridine(34) 5-carboxymethylaminomethyl modification radical SAM/GNAT enzyme Elp3 [Anaerolineaceae bacterium]|jgi:elongator complex protein 3